MEKVKELIAAACQDLGIEIDVYEIHLEHPADESHGDYATNIAMAKFGKFKSSNPQMFKKIKSPMGLAELIAEKLRGTNHHLLATVEAKLPGFINFWLKKDYLIELALELNEEKKIKNKLQHVVGGKKTMVIDYSAPNIAKPFGVGHLRSTNIGQAVYNLYSILGWKTIGDNHLGDWGTQFGKLIVAIKKWWPDNLTNLTIDDLEALYVKFHQQAEEDPDLEDEARKWFKKLEEGDKEAKEIWQVSVDISLKEFNRLYELLGVEIDEAYGESFYHFQGWMDKVISDLEERKMLRQSQGAKVVEIDGFETPAMVAKSDGATTYLTRDLAAVKFRVEKWNPDLIVYEVGGEQKFHFQQVFKAAEKLGYISADKLVHLAHGLLRVKGEKLSTRKGKTIYLEKVLSEAVKRAEKLVEKSQTSKDLTSMEKQEIAKVVGIGGVKFNDLKQEPEKNIVFDWNRILSMEGYSAPYLQYTFARTQSVLAKTKSYKLKAKSCEMNEEEYALLRVFYQFPEIIISAAENFGPHLVCQYLFDLAQKFNLFYQKHRILDAKLLLGRCSEGAPPRCDEARDEVENFRLFLTQTTASILKTGLEILGIKTIDQM